MHQQAMNEVLGQVRHQQIGGDDPEIRGARRARQPRPAHQGDRTPARQTRTGAARRLNPGVSSLARRSAREGAVVLLVSTTTTVARAAADQDAQQTAPALLKKNVAAASRVGQLELCPTISRRLSVARARRTAAAISASLASGPPVTMWGRARPRLRAPPRGRRARRGRGGSPPGRRPRRSRSPARAAPASARSRSSEIARPRAASTDSRPGSHTRPTGAPANASASRRASRGLGTCQGVAATGSARVIPARSAPRTSRSSDQRQASPSSSPRARRSATAAASSRLAGLVLVHLPAGERPIQLARPGRQRHLAEIQHREARRDGGRHLQAAQRQRDRRLALVARACADSRGSRRPAASGRSGSGSAIDATRRPGAGRSPARRATAARGRSRPRNGRPPPPSPPPAAAAASSPPPRGGRTSDAKKNHGRSITLAAQSDVARASLPTQIIEQPRFDRDLDADINGRPCCAGQVAQQGGAGTFGAPVHGGSHARSPTPDIYLPRSRLLPHSNLRESPESGRRSPSPPPSWRLRRSD